MGHAHEFIDEQVAQFIRSQRVFFVATAPLSPNGLVNLSPKGLDTLRILDDCTVAYLDLTGSGVETLAHLRENGRIVVMFCAFDGPPKIIRLHGRGEGIEPGMPDFDSLAARFDQHPGIRSVIRIRVKRIATSCGFGVPLMDFRGSRSELDDSSLRRGEDGLREYRKKKNSFSLDGLPGITLHHE